MISFGTALPFFFTVGLSTSSFSFLSQIIEGVCYEYVLYRCPR